MITVAVEPATAVCRKKAMLALGCSLMLPSVCASLVPAMAFSKVDFPAPLGPTMA